MEKIKLKFTQFVAWLGRSFWFGLKMWMWLIIGLLLSIGAFFVIFKKNGKSKKLSR